MDIITSACNVNLQIYYKLNFVLCFFVCFDKEMSKKCSIANSSTKFCVLIKEASDCVVLLPIHHGRRTQTIVFGYLSFNLAPFRTMFGYFRYKNLATLKSCQKLVLCHAHAELFCNISLHG